VLLLERVEQTSRGPEIRDACGHRNTGASNHDNFTLLVENIEQALKLWLVLVGDILGQVKVVRCAPIGIRCG
jgi:hypothetical protein